ncbi:acyltransferase [Pseudomonas gingeri]|uniref:acyltransferase family protein n=1 Tax=Pseudomonas gingeri TaxID=117681 RepID=UPI0015A21338|nr:acyltransferase [Pseudomonas gingeri]NWD69520.1 acyltransferase [Pseudomonas gingeri]
MNAKFSGRIVFLDYMRIVAFMSVVVGHEFFIYLVNMAQDKSLHATFRYMADMLIPLFQGGAAGVVIFFLSSGYIITHVLQRETTQIFLVRRVLRIYPLYIFAVLAESLFATVSFGAPFPSLSIMLARLTLTGDFFDTPYALTGVEWSLRIEVLFYLFMALVKYVGLFKAQRLLPWVYVGMVVFFLYAPAFPDFAVWSDGYFNIYAPFLLAGSCVYLIEKRLANAYVCTAAVILVMVVFCLLMSSYHPAWKESNFAVMALTIFLVSWHWGRFLKDGLFLRMTSEITYSVYLFHGWLWAYIKSAMKGTGLSGLTLDVAVFAILLCVCYCLTVTVERRGIYAGRWISNRLNNKQIGSPLQDRVPTPG